MDPVHEEEHPPEEAKIKGAKEEQDKPSAKDWRKGPFQPEEIIQVPIDPNLKATLLEAYKDFNDFTRYFLINTNV